MPVVALYLPDLDAVFIHVPKAGGTWVEAALSSSGLRMEAAKGPGRHGLPWAYQSARHRFAFVRHPLRWVESAWRGLRDGWPQRREVLPLHRERTYSPIRFLTYLAGERDFSGFIENLLANQRGFVTRMYESYVGPPGCPFVDFVGRQEHLRDDLQQILEWLGWNGRLSEVPPANEGPRDECLWDAGMKVRFLSSEAVAVNRWYGSTPGPWRVSE